MDTIGMPPPYHDDSCDCNRPAHIKYELQAGICIPFNALTACLVKYAWGKNHRQPSPRFLDIGSGLGFSLCFARILGFAVKGIEPSQVGPIAESLFQVESANGFFEELNLTGESFDVIHSSEVIEHVADPVQFICSIAKALKNDGILILTTPNSEAAIQGEKFEREWLEVYSPGYHLNIFSAKSIGHLLKRHGVRDVHILKSEGSSGKKRLLVVAAKKKGVMGPWPSMDVLKKESRLLTTSFLENIIRQERPEHYHQWLYEGALFRLFEEYTNAGLYQQADRMRDRLDQFLESNGYKVEDLKSLDCDDLESCLRQAPAFTSMYIYLKGMLDLNDKQDYQGALEKFKLAEYLYLAEMKLPHYNATRQTWFERARYHQGLALLYSGRQDEALLIFKDFLKSSVKKISRKLTNSILWNTGIALLQKGEDLQAISAFTKLLLRESWRSRNSKKTIRHIGKALRQWQSKLITKR